MSQHIRSRFAKDIIFPRTQRKAPDHAPTFAPDKKTSVSELHKAVREVVGKIPKQETVPKATIKKVVSLEDTIERLIQRATTGARLSFRDFSGHNGKAEERVTVIVSFLAMLELVKQGTLLVQQGASFSDITIENQSISVPTYQ